jgi:CSLREA domain-containing protein
LPSHPIRVGEIRTLLPTNTARIKARRSAWCNILLISPIGLQPAMTLPTTPNDHLPPSLNADTSHGSQSGMKAALLLGATGLASAASAATITVNSIADNTTRGDGQCTLREALANANGHSDTTGGDCAAGIGDNVIDLTGVSGTISLNGTQLRVVESVVINGPGAGILTVDARNLSRAFYVYKPTTNINVTISGLTVTHGSVAPGKSGSAIQNKGEVLTLSNVTIQNSKPELGVVANLGGSLTLQNATLSGNTGGTTAGGAVYSHGGDLSISLSTITGNAASRGAGVFSQGDHSISISDTTINDNAATLRGGGLEINAVSGDVSLTHSLVTGNTAQTGAGIALVGATQPTTITDSTVANNNASYAGGGIFFYRGTAGGTLTIERTTISGNQASGAHDGGGMFLYRTNTELMIRNSTISGNRAGRSGGGLFMKGPFGASQNTDIVSSTIASNIAVTAGGNIDGGSSANSISMADTIVAGGTAGVGPDIASHSADVLASYSLIQNNSGTTLNGASTNNLLNVDPQLSALAANGGPNDTMALAGTSPAIGAGHNAASLTTDQRGSAYPRPAFGTPDIGAFEYQGPITPAATSGVFTVPPYETRFLRGAGTVTMSDSGTLFLISADAIVGSLVTLPPTGRVTIRPTFLAGENTLIFSNIASGTRFTVSAVDAITVTGGSATVTVTGKASSPSSLVLYAGDTVQFAQDGTVQYVRVADAQIGGNVSSAGITGLTLNPPSVKIDGTSPHLNGARLDTMLFGALASALGTTASSGSINAQGTVLLTTAKGVFAYAPTSITVNPAAPAAAQADSGNLQLRLGTLLVNLVPALNDPAGLINSLKTLTGRSTIVQRAATGAFQLQPTGLLYMALPDSQIQASTQAAGLNATTRYADLVSADGHVQRLYPAFYDAAQLISALQSIDAKSTLRVQADGTALVSLKGQNYQFIPDWQVSPTPYFHLQDAYWVEDGKLFIGYSNHYHQSFTIVTALSAH